MKQALIVRSTLGILLFVCLFGAPAAHADTAITTCAELQGMRNDRSEHYYLANDIDCAGFDANSDGKGFEPIGTSTEPFTGTFNGNNYTISNLWIDRSTEDNVSIFGFVHGQNGTTTLKDFAVRGTIEGRAFVAALVDYADYGSNLVIDNVTSSVAITGHGSTVGGLVAQSEAATTTISSARVTGNVSVLGATVDVNQVGGLVGTNSLGLSISDSSVSGNVSVTTTQDAGSIAGLVGEFIGERISDSYVTGSVAVNAGGMIIGVGGLVGQLSPSGSEADVESSHTTGTISVQGDNVRSVSSLIGKGSRFNVNRSYSTGPIIIDDSASVNYGVGGIVGSYGGGGAIDTAFSTSNITVQITGNLQHGVGGIVGYEYGDLDISNSFYANNITVTSDTDYINGLGGIMGWADGTTTIDRSYAVSELTSDAHTLSGYIGGLAGYLGNERNVLSNAFHFGKVSATAEVVDESTIVAVGQVIGDGNFATLENVYWENDEQDALWSCAGANIVTSNECTQVKNNTQYFKGNATYAPLNAWDFNGVWKTVAGNFPNLRALPAVHSATSRPGHHRGRVVTRAPAVTSSSADMQAQLASLLAQFKQLTGHEFHASAGAVASVVASSSVRDLEFGMIGEDVRSLQNLLIAQDLSLPAGATGYFGSQTRTALAAYQKAHGLAPAIGYFGPRTRALIKMANLPGVWW